MVLCIENERLPTELGWSKREELITLFNITEATAMVANATSLLTGDETVAKEMRRDNVHGFVASALKA